MNWLSTKEVAARCGVTPVTIGAWRKAGSGPPYFQMGQSFRYLESDFQHWFNKHYIRPEVEMKGAA